MDDILDEKPRAKRRRIAATRAARPDEEDNGDMIFTVVIDPLGTCKFFPTRKKARKYARRHRKEIEAAFDW